jgi:hypothetical protein
VFTGQEEIAQSMLVALMKDGRETDAKAPLSGTAA